MKKEYMRPALVIVEMGHAGILMDSPDFEVDTESSADDDLEALSGGFDDSGFDRSDFVWFDE